MGGGSQGHKGGGAGVRNLAIFNKDLLGKWLWRYPREEHRLWRRVVDARGGCSRLGWGPVEGNFAYGVCLWKHITKEWVDFSKNT